jgi:hypothetical protein
LLAGCAATATESTTGSGTDGSPIATESAAVTPTPTPSARLIPEGTAAPRSETRRMIPRALFATATRDAAARIAAIAPLAKGDPEWQRRLDLISTQVITSLRSDDARSVMAPVLCANAADRRSPATAEWLRELFAINGWQLSDFTVIRALVNSGEPFDYFWPPKPIAFLDERRQSGSMRSILLLRDVPDLLDRDRAIEEVETVIQGAIGPLRWQALETLAALDWPRAEKMVNTALNGPNTEARRAAIAAILYAPRDAERDGAREGEGQKPAAYAACVANWEHPNSQIRQQVVKTLGALKSPAAIELLHAMVYDGDADVRREALVQWARNARHGGETPRELLDLVDSAETARAVVRCFHAVGSNEADPLLHSYLKGHAAEVAQTLRLVLELRITLPSKVVTPLIEAAQPEIVALASAVLARQSPESFPATWWAMVEFAEPSRDAVERVLLALDGLDDRATAVGLALCLRDVAVKPTSEMSPAQLGELDAWIALRAKDDVDGRIARVASELALDASLTTVQRTLYAMLFAQAAGARGLSPAPVPAAEPSPGPAPE